MTKLKQWQAEQEAKELREQMKKDRDDERAARRRVKEQIAKDRYVGLNLGVLLLKWMNFNLGMHK